MARSLTVYYKHNIANILGFSFMINYKLTIVKVLPIIFYMLLTKV